jgi:predicted DCC family thiol-disulfide oxidoreductase YuxK
VDQNSVELFYDGDCPLCRREIAMLRRLDRLARIEFTDIAAPGFDPTPLGKTHADLMARIHGRRPDGSLVEGVEVFRLAYQAVGLGPLVALTRLPGVRGALDVAYAVFAKNRLRLTGRCSPDTCAITPAAVSGKRELRPEGHRPVASRRVRRSWLQHPRDASRLAVEYLLSRRAIAADGRNS